MVSTKRIAEMTTKRQEIVALLHSTGNNPTQITRELTKRGLVNPRSKKPFTRTTVLHDLKQISAPQDLQVLPNGMKVFRRPLAETIGQWTLTKPLWNARILYNVDTTWKDYVFLDALRRGTAPGYEIGGLFCMPIAQTIASHVLGDGISASLMDSAISSDATRIHEDGKPTRNLKNAQAPNSRKPGGNAAIQVLPKAKPNPIADTPAAWTNAQIKRFLERNQGFIQTVLVDKYCFGNQYAIVNPDCTLAIISPETVTVEYSAADYRRPVRYIIRTKMEKCRVEDVYTADERTVTYHYYDGRQSVTEHYENLIGRIPIVHFVCDRSANEIYGRPIYEAAIHLMRNIDDLMYTMTEGVKVLGNPIPTFEGLENIDETKKANSDARTYVDEDGNTQTEYVTRIDRNTGLWLGRGAKAHMLGPQVGFTKDLIDAQRQYFLQLLNHTRIPEFVWGGAINSSKASAETQLPPFLQYIKFRRLEMEGEGADPALGIDARGGILELIDIWLRTYKLINPSIVVGPVRIEWPSIDIEDNLLKYQWGTYLSSQGKISDEDLVGMPGYWSDPAEVVARAAGQKRRQPKFDDYEAKLQRARLDAMRASLEPPARDADGLPYSTDYARPEIDLRDAGGELENTPDVYNPFGPLQWQHMFSGY